MSAALPDHLAEQLLRGLQAAVEDVGQVRGLAPLEIAQRVFAPDVSHSASTTPQFEDDAPRTHFSIAPSQSNMAMSVDTQRLRNLLDDADVLVMNYVGLQQIAAVRACGTYEGFLVTVCFFLEPRNLDPGF